jgi:uncharacterized membrane protein YbaN (DUF454 family)
MKKKVKKILIFIVGLTFVLLGLLGLVLPFLQGILFLIIGIFLISLSLPKFQQWIKKRAEKSPSTLGIIEKVENWVAKNIGEL